MKFWQLVKIKLELNQNNASCISNVYIMVKQTSLFPFSNAKRACFIPVTETSILDRSTE